MLKFERPDMEIRRLGHEDIADLVALMTDVTSRLPSKDHFASDNETYYHTYVLEDGEIHGAYLRGQFVAYTVLTFPKMRPGNLGREFGVAEDDLHEVACLEGTVVHESARGLGLQRYFLRLREQRARENGCRYVYATVHPDNHASVKNLESEGFVRRFTRPMYGGKLRHCYAKQLRQPGEESEASG